MIRLLLATALALSVIVEELVRKPAQRTVKESRPMTVPNRGQGDPRTVHVLLDNDEAAYLVMLFRESRISGGVKAPEIHKRLVDKLEGLYCRGKIVLPDLIASQF